MTVKSGEQEKYKIIFYYDENEKEYVAKVHDLPGCKGKGCSHSAFSSAMAGKGARKIRVLIALALGILPSKLWTERSYAIKKMDDEQYLHKRQRSGSTIEDVPAL